MEETQLWRLRATHVEGGQYVVNVPDASIPTGNNRVEYSFCCFPPDDAPMKEIEAPRGKWGFVLRKEWDTFEDMGGHPIESRESEFCIFDFLDAEEDLKPAVESLLREARELSETENLDEFLAVLDLVKDRILEAQIDDEGILDQEPFFGGVEDAYSVSSWGGGAGLRLHRNVEESARRCWRLHTAKVLSEVDREPMGFAVVAVHFPGLHYGAGDDELKLTNQIELIYLGDFYTQDAAYKRHASIAKFMQDERLLNPVYSGVSDLLMFEFNAVDTGDDPVWDILEGIDAKNFLDNPVLLRERLYLDFEFGGLARFSRQNQELIEKGLQQSGYLPPA